MERKQRDAGHYRRVVEVTPEMKEAMTKAVCECGKRCEFTGVRMCNRCFARMYGVDNGTR